MKSQSIFKTLLDLQTTTKSLNLIDHDQPLDFTWALRQNKKEIEALIALVQENMKSDRLYKEKHFTLETDSDLT